MSAPRSSETTRLFFKLSGHVALDDPAGQTLHDRGLSDAGLPDQDRVVLRPAAEHLDHPSDLSRLGR